MKLCFLAVVPLLAQNPEPAQPPAENPLRMWSDIGYRFLAGQHGSLNAYRSVVNLGEGPKLLQFQSVYKPPSRQILDELKIHGANWGDPLNTLQVNAEKNSVYRALFQYRNLAYFNALPSFASPQLARLGPEAFTTNQRSMDTRQRFLNFDLDLLPGKRWQPFFGIAHNSGRGHGVSPIVLDENSYPGANRIDFGYTVFRGGLRYEGGLVHAHLEQGGATFADASSLLNTTRNTGNRDLPYLGRTLSLDDTSRLHDVTGSHIYSSGDLTLTPANWIDISTEFYFSQPRSKVRFNESARGSLFWLDALRFVNGQQSLATGYANQPRVSGAVTLEVRPHRRLRIIDSIQTERTHNAGSLALSVNLDGRAQRPLNFTDRLIWHQHEQRLQAFHEVHNKLTIFGGHRYLWGDAQVRRAELAPGGPLEQGYLNRHSAIGGFIYRPLTKLILNGETEVGRGGQTYFRTSLRNFEQVRLRARYQLSERWQFNARFHRLDNRNPTPGVNLNFASQQSNLTWQYTSKKLAWMADYTRATIRSDIGMVVPIYYDIERSLYRDNAHVGSLAVDLNLPRKSSVMLGGTFFRSAGSRPSRMYQPLARLRVAVGAASGLLVEWRHVSLGQALYSYEAFGVQQFIFGLRIGK